MTDTTNTGNGNTTKHPSHTIDRSFPLGRLVITTNAARRLTPREIRDALKRHECGDWGDLPPEDTQENERSLRQGGRLFSAYGGGERRFWIITEADRSVTTALLPADY